MFTFQHCCRWHLVPSHPFKGKASVPSLHPWMTGGGWRPPWTTLSLDDAMVRAGFWWLLHTTTSHLWCTISKSTLLSSYTLLSARAAFNSFSPLLVIFSVFVWKRHVTNQLTLSFLRRHPKNPSPCPPEQDYQPASVSQCCCSHWPSRHIMPSPSPFQPPPLQPALLLVYRMNAPAFISREELSLAIPAYITARDPF